jgi:hypothetical protein
MPGVNEDDESVGDSVGFFGDRVFAADRILPFVSRAS